MIFIIAGHFEHAKRLAHELGLLPGQWRFFHDAMQARGLNSGQLVLLTETAHHHPEAVEIIEVCQSNGMQIRDINLDQMVYRRRA